jgi:flagellar motor switch protein FliN
MAQPSEPAQENPAVATGVTETSAVAALVRTPAKVEAANGIAVNRVVARLPIEIDVCVPVRNFRARNLLALEEGQVIVSLWRQGDDLPLGARGSQLAWSEFEVIDQKLAVRITRLL